METHNSINIKCKETCWEHELKWNCQECGGVNHHDWHYLKEIKANQFDVKTHKCEFCGHPQRFSYKFDIRLNIRMLDCSTTTTTSSYPSTSMCTTCVGMKNCHYGKEYYNLLREMVDYFWDPLHEEFEAPFNGAVPNFLTRAAHLLKVGGR